MKRALSNIITPALWLAFAGWLSVLWLVSALPGSSAPSWDIPFADKILHFGYFAIGGALVALLARRTFAFRGIRMFAVVFAVIATVGALDEFHQTHTPGRSGNDWGDLLADCAGGVAGAIMIGWFYVRKARPAGTGDLAPSGD